MELLKNNKRIFPLIGAIIVFILSFSVLYMGDNIGLSDNGDFRRVLLVNNMEYENDSNYYYLFKQDPQMKVDLSGSNLACNGYGSYHPQGYNPEAPRHR